MVLDPITSNWNNILTIASFVIASLIGWYQIQNIRSQRAKINISEVKDASYIPREEVEVNSQPHSVPNPEDMIRTRPADINESELIDTYYSVTVLLENAGREPATISKAELILPDTAEVLELINDHDNPRRISAHLELDGNTRDTVNFTTSGNIREDNTGPVYATFRLDTTAGIVNESLELTRPIE